MVPDHFPCCYLTQWLQFREHPAGSHIVNICMIRNSARGHTLWQPPASLVAVGEMLSKLMAVAPGGEIKVSPEQVGESHTEPQGGEKKANWN